MSPMGVMRKGGAGEEPRGAKWGGWNGVKWTHSQLSVCPENVFGWVPPQGPRRSRIKGLLQMGPWGGYIWRMGCFAGNVNTPFLWEYLVSKI